MNKGSVRWERMRNPDPEIVQISGRGNPLTQQGCQLRREMVLVGPGGQDAAGKVREIGNSGKSRVK